MSLKSSFQFFIAVVLPLEVIAQVTDCGEAPVVPAIVDGATATKEQLVANSKEVNAYIASADEFLDCSEMRYKRLSSSRMHKDDLAEQIRAVTALRNEIGGEFNAEVEAYRAANTE